MPNRRGFFLTFAGIAAIGASAGGAQTLSTVRIAITNTSGFTVYFAQETGMFRRAGLDVQVQNLGQGAAIAAAISGHSVDVGLSNVVTIAQARERGLAFAFVAPDTLYLSTAPNTQVVVLPQSPVRTAKDLNGQSVGTASVAGILRLAIDAWVDRNGGDISAVKFVEIQPAETLAALQRGTIAAAMMNDPLLSAVRPQLRVIGSPLDAIGPRLIITGWFAANDWIAQNPQTVRTLASVIAQAARWGNDPKNRTQAAAIIAKYSPEQTNFGTTVYAETMDAALVQPVLDSAAKFKLLDHPLAAGDIIARN